MAIVAQLGDVQPRVLGDGAHAVSSRRVRVDDHGVTLVGVLSARRHAWDRIAGAWADWCGLHLLLDDGQIATSVAISMPALHRAPTARLAELIAAEARRRHAGRESPRLMVRT